MRATDLLHEDHQRVNDLFARLEQAAGDKRQTLLDEVADELEVHTQIEEELFYPAVERASGRIEDARAAHQHVRDLVGDVQGRDPGSPEFVRGLVTLKGAVLAHVVEEEGGMFLDAGHLGADALEQLGTRLQQRKQELQTSLLQRGKRAVKTAAQKVA